MFWQKKKEKVSRDSEEPLFVGTSNTDLAMSQAYVHAAGSVGRLIDHFKRDGSHFSLIKMRFRDPDLSDRLGEDRFLFLWLLLVQYEESKDLFAVRFFEVPTDFQKWHKPGDQLVIERDQIFDWYVNDGGKMYGGFTMRVTRSRMPLTEQIEFDKHIGATEWVTTGTH